MAEWSFDTWDVRAAQATRRDFAQRVNYFYGSSADVMAAELVLGELIGNAVRYAPGPTHVQADFDESGVTIAVQDSGRGFSSAVLDRKSGLLSESGRGLAIVSQLTEILEIRCPNEDGCCVRARLGLRRGAPPPTATADTFRRPHPDVRA
jgi:anti-sigma regulatory factor (Ser/Thr protein kinase)